MKKVLSIMLIILVVFSSMPMTVFGAGNQDNSNDEFTYALSEDNAIITGYNGSDLFVDIPSEIDGHSVTEISSTTFKNDNSIVGIEIPNGVTTIGQGAFKNCLKAQYISLPATLKNIDTNTLTSNDDCVYIVERNSDAEKFVTENDMNYKKRFASDKVSESGQDDNISYRYNNLTSSLYVYGEGEIKNYNSDNQPWKNYKSTAKSIDLFDGITSIGNYAFYNFTSVTPEVTIPSSVEKIGNSAFDCCTSLKKITIPDNVKIIGNRAFGSCTSVTEIELGTGLIQLGTDYRDYNNPFYYMTGVKKITFNSEKVPTTPCADTFEYMNNLETVYVPAKSYSQYVERFSSYINNAKFVLLNDDTDFIIEDGVLKLYQGNDANIVIPSDVTEIGPSAFRNNASIKTVEFSSNVEKISNNAFMGCTSLKSVALNNKLTTISYSSFNSCSALKEITIPDSVETIGDYAFYFCDRLSDVSTSEKSGIKTIGSYAFYGCTIRKFYVPYGTESIGEGAFKNCDTLTYIDFPGTVKEIGDNALYGTYSDLKTAGYGKAAEYADKNGFPFTETVRVRIDGREIAFDSPARVKDGCTMVPMRKIFEELGAEVEWDDSTQTAKGEKSGTVCTFSIGDNMLYKNGEAIELIAPAILENNRTLVHVRAIAEAFGADVEWIGDTGLVEIKSAAE